MTTVAANLSCMAADLKVTDGDCSYLANKLWVIHGCLVGVAGRAQDTNVFLEWFMAGRKKNERPIINQEQENTFEALVLNHQGLFIFWDCGMPDKIDTCHRPYYAIGTGKPIALAMMRRGHSPREAVQMASEIDNGTGATVRSIYLSELGRRHGGKKSKR